MKRFYKLFIAMFCIAIGLSPVIAYAEETTTVEVTIDSDYDNVIVESESGKENVNNKNLILTFSDVGEYEYKIYTNEDLENIYTVKVLVGRNDNNQLYTETVLYNNKNKDVKLDKIEFKKKMTPEEPKQEEPKKVKGEDIATGVLDNSLMWGAIITLCAIALYLSKKDDKKWER